MTTSTLPFSTLRRAGDAVHLSGELGFDETGKISGDIARQTEMTLRRIEATLAGAGLSRRDIVSCTCYLVRKEDFPGFNQVYRAFFNAEPLPVRATVVADLVLDALIEISVIAHASTN
ncbi:RidA family protein [Mesorhizobium sp. M8A.F.Ca.ET.173.01.1.1]|nr:RidA family protein [Mesorhizobium sp. M8A.F.Ca.ET.173.01.1.1]